MTGEARAGAPSRRGEFGLGLLAVALVARLWAMPLTSSLWLDEFGTVWVTGGGFGRILERARLFPQSVTYAAIACGVREAFGASEAALRLPSLLAMLGAVWCVFGLGRALFDRETGILGAGVFLLYPQIEFAASDARPYAFGVLAAAAALWALVRWLDRARPGFAVVYVLCAAATVYFHYLFALTLIGHAVYALWRAGRNSPVSGGAMFVTGAALGLALVPAAAMAAEISGRRAWHAFPGKPHLNALFHGLVPTRVLGILVPVVLLCGLLRIVSGLRAAPRRGRNDAFLLLVVASEAPALALFALARLDGTNVFLDRYLMGAVPAQAVLLGALLRTVEPERGRRGVLGGALLLALLLRGELRHFEIAHGREDWRAAVAAANALKGDGRVLLGGSFIEARDLRLVESPVHAAYLAAPLDYYRPRGTVSVLPLGLDPATESYVAGLLAAPPGAGRVALIERRSGFPSWEPWLRERLAASGYTMKDVWGSSTLKVRVFERRAPVAGIAGD